MEIAFLIVGLPFLVFGFILRHYLKRVADEGKRAIGTIVDHVKKPEAEHRTTWKQLIEVDGRFCLSSVASRPPSGEVGDPITVFINKRHPNKVYVHSRFLEALPPILIVMSLGFLAGFYFTFKWDRFSLIIAGVILAQLAYSLWKKSRQMGPAKQAWQKAQRDFTLYSEFLSDEELSQLIRLSRHPDAAQARRKWKPNRATGAVMMALAIAGFSGSIIWGQKRAQFIESAAKAPGKIVSSQRSSGSKSNVYYPIIDFYPQGSQESIRFKGDFGTSHPSWRVGDQVVVLYDPFDPQKAIMEDGLWMYFFPILIGGMAALFFLIGWANLFARSNRRKRSQPPGAHRPRRAA